MRTLFLTAIAMFGLAMASNSMDAPTLLRSCGATSRIVEKTSGAPTEEANNASAQCLDYLDGFIGAHTVLAAINPESRLFCPSPTITFYQYARIVIKHIDAHPEHLHYGGEVLVAQAFTNAFPCPGKNKEMKKPADASKPKK